MHLLNYFYLDLSCHNKQLGKAIVKRLQ